VERRPDPADRRATRVHLTGKGLRFKPVAERVLADLEQIARDALGERTLSGAARALAKLAELENGEHAVRASDPSPGPRG
jgi:DNA-binding MarR family transcriptional regulator